MADEAFGRSLPLCGHHHGGQRQLGAHMVAHGPADDLAGRQVEDGSQIQPSLTSRDVSDVGQPNAVLCQCDELVLQQVRSDGQMVAAVSRAWLEPATGERANTVTTHQPHDAATTCRPAFRAQRDMHSWGCRNGHDARHGGDVHRQAARGSQRPERYRDGGTMRSSRWPRPREPSTSAEQAICRHDHG